MHLNILNSDYHESLSAVVAACTCLKIIDSQGRKKWPSGSIVVSWNTFFRLRLSRIGSRYRFRVRPKMAK